MVRNDAAYIVLVWSCFVGHVDSLHMEASEDQATTQHVQVFHYFSYILS